MKTTQIVLVLVGLVLAVLASAWIGGGDEPSPTTPTKAATPTQAATPTTIHHLEREVRDNLDAVSRGAGYRDYDEFRQSADCYGDAVIEANRAAQAEDWEAHTDAIEKALDC